MNHYAKYTAVIKGGTVIRFVIGNTSNANVFGLPRRLLLLKRVKIAAMVQV